MRRRELSGSGVPVGMALGGGLLGFGDLVLDSALPPTLKAKQLASVCYS